MIKIFQRIKEIIKYRITKWIEPQMNYSFKRADGVVLQKTRIGSTTCIGNKEKLYIEDGVYIGHYNNIDASNHITIKEGCQISNFIIILTHSSHISIRLYGRHYHEADSDNIIGYEKGKVYIGEYTFIGPHSIIMPNTKIGKGCIVAAYSYVRGEYPDFSIIAGNPAKIVGDTRKMDEPFLQDNMQLTSFYNEWVK